MKAVELNMVKKNRISLKRYHNKSVLFILAVPIILFVSNCSRLIQEDVISPTLAEITNTNSQYNITQSISDEAQLNTISFDGLAFLTGNLGAQSFLPPGKVADYSGFQFLRDNDPTQLGHNTSFVTIISNNILNILTTDQINTFISRAKNQVDLINQFAYKRYPLLKAFRRLKEGDIPSGTSQLSKDEVMNYAAELYKLDGQISYDRAQLFGTIVNSLSSAQKTKLEALKALNGIGNWNKNLSNPLDQYGLQKDVNVAVMTYASEMYAWYAGSVTADTYFCPERHATYFGSFYLKDWPAMGNPNYTINEQLTASAGQNFLSILNEAQLNQIKGIVDLQKSALMELVEKRKSISTELRKFLSSQNADQSTILSLSQRYGELDGDMGYYYASIFTQVYNSLTNEQKSKLTLLASNLGYVNPTGAFLYSEPITMPVISNTDYMFK